VRDRLLRDGFAILAVVFVGLRLLAIEPWAQSVDAYAYWSTRGGVHYTGDTGAIGSYLYTPAFAQVLWPLIQLPWPVFSALWTAFLCLVYWLLVGRLALPILLTVAVPFEIVSGNVHLLYAAAIVIGFRFPAAWALMLLTKVTPGIGLIWFAVRREWSSLAWAMGVTTAITIVSYLLAPGAWAQWLDLVIRSLGGPIVTTGPHLPAPLIVRLPIAAIIVAWGGLTDRRWTVPIAVTLALPVVWFNSLATLVALVPLLRLDHRPFHVALPDRVRGGSPA
jgi:hypothetical protein